MNEVYSFDPEAVAKEIIPILAKHNIRISCLPAIWERVLQQAQESYIQDMTFKDQEIALQEPPQPER